MIEVLSGLGLAAAAGVNAYVPMIVLGLFVRYTSVLDMPAQWTWLGNGWLLLALLALLLVELVTDKIPVLDHLNDLVHTLVRPVAGGVVFAAIAARGEPDTATAGPLVATFAAGLVLALAVHIAKAAGRAVVNRSTRGAGAPVLSTVEDLCALLIALVAILAPVLMVLVVAGGSALAVWIVRQRRQGLLSTGYP